ncbi:MAG TPA: hypothetical protein VMG09_01235 [Bacteroidota bacterium]|nr:hypothetical protein [Bacteroidota bacterium]
MKKSLVVFIVGMVVVLEANAFGASGDSSNSWIPGMLFSTGATDGTILNNGNALSVWLGAGYDVSSSVRVSALFSTGHHHIDPAPARPVDGTLLLGAAALEILYRFSSGSALSPFVAVDGGLSTVLDAQGRGYNGWMVEGKAGMEWTYSPSLGIDGFVGWSGWTWQNGIGANVPPFDPFHPTTVAVGLSVIFHPVLHRQS